MRIHDRPSERSFVSRCEIRERKLALGPPILNLFFSSFTLLWVQPIIASHVDHLGRRREVAARTPDNVHDTQKNILAHRMVFGIVGSKDVAEDIQVQSTGRQTGKTNSGVSRLYFWVLVEHSSQMGQEVPQL